MKKLLLNALFMGLATLAFAQPKFTEQTLTEVHQAFITDALKAVAERTSPDFVMIGSNGQTRDYAGFKALNESGGIVEWPVSEVKIIQAGNLAIVTSISNHAAVFKQTNAKFKAHERATETFEFQNGKWMYKSAHYTNIQPRVADEEAAIKKVLVDERNAFFAGDKDIEKYWKDDPKTVILTSYPSGRHNFMDNERRKTLVSQFKAGGNGHVGTITSSKVQVYGKMAVANVEMTVNYKNGSEAKERQLVILEKNGDNWQIINYSLHGVPKETKDEEEAIKKMLDEEKKASDAADFKAYKSHWVEAPYVSFQYNGLSFVGDAFWKSAEEKFAGKKPSNNITTRSDWNFTIKGGAAFVTFSQKTENVEKKTTYETYEQRYVEKVNGEWKMVNMTAIKKAN